MWRSGNLCVTLNLILFLQRVLDTIVYAQLFIMYTIVE
jgi:hypothetical protein